MLTTRLIIVLLLACLPVSFLAAWAQYWRDWHQEKESVLAAVGSGLLAFALQVAGLTVPVAVLGPWPTED